MLAPGTVLEGETGEHDGALVKLIDFGRSIDLKAVEAGGTIVGLFGDDAAAEDMSPPAMTEGRPWKEDLDTYGVLSVAHVLLWGSHLSCGKDVKGRWR